MEEHGPYVDFLSTVRVIAAAHGVEGVLRIGKRHQRRHDLKVPDEGQELSVRHTHVAACRVGVESERALKQRFSELKRIAHASMQAQQGERDVQQAVLWQVAPTFSASCTSSSSNTSAHSSSTKFSWLNGTTR